MNIFNIERISELSDFCLKTKEENPEIEFISSFNVLNIVPEIEFVNFWSQNNLLKELFLTVHWAFNNKTSCFFKPPFNVCDVWELIKTFCLLKVSLSEINSDNFYLAINEATFIKKICSFVESKIDFVLVQNEIEKHVKNIEKPICCFLCKVKNEDLFNRLSVKCVIHCQEPKSQTINEISQSVKKPMIYMCKSFEELVGVDLSEYSPLEQVFLTENQEIILSLLLMLLQAENCEKNFDLIFKKFFLSEGLLKEINQLAQEHSIHYAINYLKDSNKELKKIKQILEQNKNYFSDTVKTLNSDKQMNNFFSIDHFVTTFIKDMKPSFVVNLFGKKNRDYLKYEVFVFIQKLKSVCDEKTPFRASKLYDLISFFNWKCHSNQQDKNKYLAFKNEISWKYYELGRIQMFS